MKKNIQVINDEIVSNLEFDVNSKTIVFNINNSCDVDLFLENNKKDIKINFHNNCHVNLTSIFSKGESNISYILGNSTYLNEFVIVEDDNIDLVINKKITQSKDSVYEVSNGVFSDANVDANIVVDLDGINAKALHNVALIARNDNKKHFNVTINNNEKMTIGELNNFGVVKDSASVIFNGTGFIKKGASLSQAHQESKIITFDPNVQAQANPFLIIDEADVEASHAAAVGKMDEEQLYYIQSRGINYDDASKLITYGYLKPILNKINDKKLKEKLEKLIEEKVNI